MSSLVFKIDTELSKEIHQSIEWFNKQIDYEMKFPEHLRKKDIIELYKNKKTGLETAIIKGFI